MKNYEVRNLTAVIGPMLLVFFSTLFGTLIAEATSFLALAIVFSLIWFLVGSVFGYKVLQPKAHHFTALWVTPGTVLYTDREGQMPTHLDLGEMHSRFLEERQIVQPLERFPNEIRLGDGELYRVVRVPATEDEGFVLISRIELPIK